MKKKKYLYRVVTNTHTFRIQRKLFGVWWNTRYNSSSYLSEFKTLTEAKDHIGWLRRQIEKKLEAKRVSKLPFDQIVYEESF